MKPIKQVSYFLFYRKSENKKSGLEICFLGRSIRDSCDCNRDKMAIHRIYHQSGGVIGKNVSIVHNAIIPGSVIGNMLIGTELPKLET